MTVDFSNAKVGDIVYSVSYGEGTIEFIIKSYDYLIRVKFRNSYDEAVILYNYSGKFNSTCRNPDLYPFPVHVERTKQKVRKYKVLYRLAHENELKISIDYFKDKEDFLNLMRSMKLEFIQLLESQFIEVEE